MDGVGPAAFYFSVPALNGGVGADTPFRLVPHDSLLNRSNSSILILILIFNFIFAVPALNGVATAGFPKHHDSLLS